MLVARLDPRSEAGHLHQRQGAVEHEGPRQKGTRHEQEKQPQIEETGGGHGSRCQHRSKHEDQGARPEAELGPDGAQGVPAATRELCSTLAAEDDTRRDDGDDAGETEIDFGHGIGQVGKGDAQRDLGGAGFIEAGKQGAGEPTRNDPEERAAGEGEAEAGEHGLQRRRRAEADDDGQEGRRDGDRGGVVQQAFALDEVHQATRCPYLLEDVDHRNGIRGGDDRTDQEAGGE